MGSQFYSLAQVDSSEERLDCYCAADFCFGFGPNLIYSSIESAAPKSCLAEEQCPSGEAQVHLASTKTNSNNHDRPVEQRTNRAATKGARVRKMDAGEAQKVRNNGQRPGGSRCVQRAPLVAASEPQAHNPSESSRMD